MLILKDLQEAKESISMLFIKVMSFFTFFGSSPWTNGLSGEILDRIRQATDLVRVEIYCQQLYGQSGARTWDFQHERDALKY